MGIVEIILVGFFAFGIGAYAGQKAQVEKGSVTQQILPEKRDTMDRMLQCRAFCGNRRTGSYDSLTGFCECINEQRRRSN